MEFLVTDLWLGLMNCRILSNAPRLSKQFSKTQKPYTLKLSKVGVAVGHFSKLFIQFSHTSRKESDVITVRGLTRGRMLISEFCTA